MNLLRKIISLFGMLILISSTQGCGSCGSGLTGFGNCGGGPNKSKINGTVVGVTGGSGVSKIKVIARDSNGKKLASDTTNSEGNFKFKVKFGSITLQFQTSTFIIARVFTITEDSEVFLDLSLEPNQVVVENWEVTQDPIRCDGSQNFILDEGDLVDFTLDGNGNDCITAKGHCFINISVQNISLNDCSEGIFTADNATLSLEALGASTLSIHAKSNGVHTNDSSSLTLTGGDVFITSTNQNGINAGGSSLVEVQPTNQCTIEGFAGAIQEDPNANPTVNTDGCILQ